MKNLMFGQAATWNDSIFLLRLWIGIIFISHGQSMWHAESMQSFKGYLANLNVPFPALSAYLCKSTEFFGGIFLVIGFLKRPACIFLIIDMMRNSISVLISR